MTFTRTLALIVGATLVLTACNNESDGVAINVIENPNPLLAYVPADTAYVYASLEPAPKEITDIYIERFQPVLDVMSEQVKKFQADYETGEYQGKQAAHFVTAVLDELGGNLSAEGFEKLGISLQAHSAIYATGVFPVIRLGLNDEQALRDAIARIETKMGFVLPVKELNGASYWHIAEDGFPLGMYLAVLDQQVALTVFPVRAEDSLLAAFLGQEMPAESMASTNALAIMNSKKGYTNYGSGIVDLKKLSDEVLNPNSDTRTFLGPEMTSHLETLDAVCIAEIESMIDKAPRMTVGSTKLSANEIGWRIELEIENSLAMGLAALVSDTPVAAQGDHLLSASLAVKVGKLRNFLLEKTNAIVATPYQCEKMQELNQQAVQLVEQLNIPMPPMVNNLMGLRVRVDDFDPATEIPKGNGLLALYVDKPEMFVGMATMMVPGFEELDLANQSEPVKIPSELIQVEGIDVFALVSDNAIGASVGERNARDLGTFLSAKSQDDGTFLSFSHDMAKQLEIQAALSDTLGIDQDEQHSSAHEYSEAVKQSYTAMLDRSRVDMRLTSDGLIIDSSMTFK
jgi:hypothetical protein